MGTSYRNLKTWLVVLTIWLVASVASAEDVLSRALPNGTKVTTWKDNGFRGVLRVERDYPNGTVEVENLVQQKRTVMWPDGKIDETSIDTFSKFKRNPDGSLAQRDHHGRLVGMQYPDGSTMRFDYERSSPGDRVVGVTVRGPEAQGAPILQSMTRGTYTQPYSPDFSKARADAESAKRFDWATRDAEGHLSESKADAYWDPETGSLTLSNALETTRIRPDGTRQVDDKLMGTTRTFDSSGRITKMQTDPGILNSYPRSATFEHDANGTLTRIDMGEGGAIERKPDGSFKLPGGQVAKGHLVIGKGMVTIVGPTNRTGQRHVDQFRFDDQEHGRESFDQGLDQVKHIDGVAKKIGAGPGAAGAASAMELTDGTMRAQNQRDRDYSQKLIKAAYDMNGQRTTPRSTWPADLKAAARAGDEAFALNRKREKLADSKDYIGMGATPLHAQIAQKEAVARGKLEHFMPSAGDVAKRILDDLPAKIGSGINYAVDHPFQTAGMLTVGIAAGILAPELMLGVAIASIGVGGVNATGQLVSGYVNHDPGMVWQGADSTGDVTVEAGTMLATVAAFKGIGSMARPISGAIQAKLGRPARLVPETPPAVSQPAPCAEVPKAPSAGLAAAPHASEATAPVAEPNVPFAIAESGQRVYAVPSSGFHGTNGITVDEVIANGLPGGGDNIHLGLHVGGVKDSAFRGLAPSPGRAGLLGLRTPVEFAGEGGVVVEVDGVPGFDTMVHAPKAVASMPKGEAETATFRKIPTERIRRIGKVGVDFRNREVVTEWTPNPNYRPAAADAPMGPPKASADDLRAAAKEDLAQRLRQGASQERPPAAEGGGRRFNQNGVNGQSPREALAAASKLEAEAAALREGSRARAAAVAEDLRSADYYANLSATRGLHESRVYQQMAAQAARGQELSVPEKAHHFRMLADHVAERLGVPSRATVRQGKRAGPDGTDVDHTWVELDINGQLAVVHPTPSGYRFLSLEPGGRSPYNPHIRERLPTPDGPGLSFAQAERHIEYARANDQPLPYIALGLTKEGLPAFAARRTMEFGAPMRSHHHWGKQRSYDPREFEMRWNEVLDEQGIIAVNLDGIKAPKTRPTMDDVANYRVTDYEIDTLFMSGGYRRTVFYRNDQPLTWEAVQAEYGQLYPQAFAAPPGH